MKKTWILISVLCWDILLANDASRKEYLDLVARYPQLVAPQGQASQGEIEIILDPERMAAIEKQTGRHVGIVQQDKYWLWINDACRFPSGHEGVYGRILWVKSLESAPGVAVMPILPDGRIGLNCNYRHATRSWEIELPRGGLNKGESAEDAARRETQEETGLVVDQLLLLGQFPVDTGITNTVVPIFAAHVKAVETAQQEETEAIEEIIKLSIEDIKTAFVKGEYRRTIRGIEKIIPFRDPFLAYAILLYELHKLK